MFDKKTVLRVQNAELSLTVCQECQLVQQTRVEETSRHVKLLFQYPVMIEICFFLFFSFPFFLNKL